MTPGPWVYPEDMSPAAVGDGVTDDWNAIQAAIGACAPWQDVYFSKNYAISQPVQANGRAFRCSSLAALTAIAGCTTGVIFSGSGNIKGECPRLIGFTAASMDFSVGVCHITCHQISAGAGILLRGGSIDNKIEVHWFSGCSSCLIVTNPPVAGQTPVVQGNIVTCTFAVGTTIGLNFDGSANCDSNSLLIAAWDSTNNPGSTIWLNAGTAVNPQPCSTWRLKVTDWIGGIPAGAGSYLANGAFQFCEFESGLLNTTSNDWGKFNIKGGGGNTFRTASATGFEGAFAANWQAAPNSRAGFGAAWYTNTRLCKGKCVHLAASELVTYYVYSPFLDGNSFGFRAQPVVNPGLELVSIVDNSSVNPNEVAITWRAVNEISPGYLSGFYQEFDFQFTAGIP